LPFSDIIALLGALDKRRGKRANAPATGQNTGLGASALLSGPFQAQLGGRIERLFASAISASARRSQGHHAATEFHRQRYDRAAGFARLVITYITDITTTQYQVIQIDTQSTVEFSFVGLRDENGTFGLDVVRKTRFK